MYSRDLRLDRIEVDAGVVRRSGWISEVCLSDFRVLPVMMVSVLMFSL